MKGEVISVTGADAVICIGYSEGANIGDLMDVYRYEYAGVKAEGEEEDFGREYIGRIKIDSIINDHFSRVSILKGDIEEGDMAELMK
jgi:hypothetical protein